MAVEDDTEEASDDMDEEADSIENELADGATLDDDIASGTSSREDDDAKAENGSGSTTTTRPPGRGASSSAEKGDAERSEDGVASDEDEVGDTRKEEERKRCALLSETSAELAVASGEGADASKVKRDGSLARGVPGCDRGTNRVTSCNPAARNRHTDECHAARNGCCQCCIGALVHWCIEQTKYRRCAWSIRHSRRLELPRG